MIGWTHGWNEALGLKGATLPVYELYPSGNYMRSEIWAFSDSVFIVLQCGKTLTTLDGVRSEFAKGRLVPFPPSGSTVVWLARAVFKVENVDSRVDSDALLSEISDVQRQLRGEAAAIDRCRDVISGYVRAPNRDRLEELRHAYEQVPAHQRPFLISMDAKDHYVRELLAAESDAEIARWTRSLASEIAYAWR